MKPREGQTQSMWYEGVAIPTRGAPGRDRTAEVCVVGAGIAGLTAAYLLAKAGKRVVVLDEGPIGSGQTGRTSAHLASASDDRFAELEHSLGEHGARLFHASHAQAIDRIEQIAREEDIDCDLVRVPGYLFAAAPEHRDRIERELQAARRAGITAHWLEHVAIGGTRRGPAIRFEDQARLHPMRYLVGLAAAAERAGARIHEGCRVTSVIGRDEGTPARVELSHGGPAFVADAIVVATNTPGPVREWAGIFFKQASYRTYVIGVAVPPGAVEDALLWDTEDPYHYLRIDPGAEHDVLVVGGQDHKTGHHPAHVDPFAELEAFTRALVPATRDVLWRWSGQIQEPVDGVAFMGRAPSKHDDVFVVTGDSGMGLTHATAGAMLIADLVMGRENPWTELYDPKRKPLRDLPTVAQELLTESKGWLDLLTPGQVRDVDAIGRGSGAIVRKGATKLAVHRDDAGQVHACSAICPHLRAVVQWNPIERSWDCPAHGSRFTADGCLVMGPAVDDLEPA